LGIDTGKTDATPKTPSPTTQTKLPKPTKIDTGKTDALPKSGPSTGISLTILGRRLNTDTSDAPSPVDPILKKSARRVSLTHELNFASGTVPGRSRSGSCTNSQRGNYIFVAFSDELQVSFRRDVFLPQLKGETTAIFLFACSGKLQVSSPEGCFSTT